MIGRRQTIFLTPFQFENLFYFLFVYVLKICMMIFYVCLPGIMENSVNCQGKVMEFYYLIFVGTLYYATGMCLCVVRLTSMLTESSLRPQVAALHGTTSISSNPPVGIPVGDSVFTFPLFLYKESVSRSQRLRMLVNIPHMQADSLLLSSVLSLCSYFRFVLLMLHLTNHHLLSA